MKRITNEDGHFRFDSAFFHAETSLLKLGTKSKKKRFMLIPNIGHNNKNETNGKSEPMPFLCKHTHTHTHEPAHVEMLFRSKTNGEFTAFNKEQHFSCRTQRHT